MLVPLEWVGGNCLQPKSQHKMRGILSIGQVTVEKAPSMDSDSVKSDEIKSQ